MACHEIAALRLSLMSLLGVDDEAEKAHELAELGNAATEEGPLQNLMNANNLSSIRSNYTDSVAKLEDRIALMPKGADKLDYYRSLLVLNRKVEMELRSLHQGVEQLYRDLEDMHDYLHEIYPVEG